MLVEADAAEIDFTPATLSTKTEEVTPPLVAVMFVVPPAALSTPVANPVVLPIVATLLLLEAKVAVTGPEVPSL
jgi:hypothetical protein